MALHRCRRENTIDFAIMATRQGQLLPLSERKNFNAGISVREGLDLLCSSFFGINTVMGEKEAVKKVTGAFPQEEKSLKSATVYSYHVMVLDMADFRKNRSVPAGVRLRLAGKSDLRELLPLQKNYEIEEVLPSPEMFNSLASRHHLCKILREQVTVVAEISGKAVAKANTNGSGFRHEQIGGVYTLPDYRGEGISTALVSFLLENIFRTGKKASLFVKTDNHSAIRVYTKLGFKKEADFLICYYLREK